MVHGPRLASAFLLPALFVAAVAQAATTQGEGVLKLRKAETDHVLLLMEDGLKLKLTLDVMRKHSREFRKLEPGKRLRFRYDDRTHVIESFALAEADDPGGGRADRRVTREAVFERYDELDKIIYLGDGLQYQVHESLFEADSTDQLRTLMFLTKGDAITILVWNNQWVMEIAKGRRKAVNVLPEVQKVLEGSRVGDEIDVQTKQIPQWTRYKLRGKGITSIKASPQDPTQAGDFINGTVPIDKEDILALRNENERVGGGAEEGGGEGGALDVVWHGVQVGDTIGIGFEKGQLVALNAEEYVLRVWRNGVWGADQPGKRDEVNDVRRGIKLDSAETRGFEGGNLEIRSNRSREGRRSGLRFEVDLSHDAKHAILVNLEIRFLLGTEVGMGPQDKAAKVEVQPVPLPMFADQRQTIGFESADEQFMDGRVDVHIPAESVIPISSPQARDHIVTVLSQTPPDRLDALRGVYKAAAENGDADVARFMITRALAEEEQSEHRFALLDGLRGGKFKAKVPELILDDLFGLDRNLKRTLLTEETLREHALPNSVRPVPYKRQLIRLLSELPGALSGTSGGRLFELYLERDDLGEAIVAAFTRRPDEAVDSLLEVAVDPRAGSDTEAMARSERATLLLRQLGEPVKDELLKVLRKRGLSVAGLDSPGRDPGDVIKEALGKLIEKIFEERRKGWDQTVEDAKSVAESDLDRAIAMIEGVRAEFPKHKGAKAAYPGLLVDRARVHLASDERGQAALLFERALELGDAKAKARGKAPLAQILVDAAAESLEGVVIRSHPHPGGAKVRYAKFNEKVLGTDAPRGWAGMINEKSGELEGYVGTDCLVNKGAKGWQVNTSVTPYQRIKELLDRAKELGSVGASANEVLGRVSAREAQRYYDEGNFQAALPLFDVAQEHTPTDPRLSLYWKCWLSAYKGAVMAVGAIVLFALGIGLMQAFSRPKRVAFSGEFKHYGADRSQLERDLDVPDDEA